MSDKIGFNERPTPSDWKCELFGTGDMMTYHPEKGKEPNFFWRWMQFVCFGSRWVKTKENQ